MQPGPAVCRAALLVLALLVAGCATQRPDGTPSQAAPEAMTGDLLGARAAARARPNDAAAQTILAEAALSAGALPEAQTAIDRAIAIGPATADRLVLQGRLALQLSDPVKAEAAYAAAEVASPNRVEVLNGAGVALGLLGRNAEAETKLRAALAQRPGDWVIRGNLAFVLVNAENARAAVAVLADAERDAAAPSRAKQNLALALVASGERDRALRVLRTDMGRVEAIELANAFARYAEGVRDQRAAGPAQ